MNTETNCAANSKLCSEKIIEKLSHDKNETNVTCVLTNGHSFMVAQ